MVKAKKNTFKEKKISISIKATRKMAKEDAKATTKPDAATAAPAAEKDKAEPTVTKKSKVALEEDDDFEDFPAEQGGSCAVFGCSCNFWRGQSEWGRGG
jgi:hypothetical protein